MNSLSAPIFDHLRYDVPNAKQIEFFESDKKYTLYGGARGGGKSWAMRRKDEMLAMRYPGIKILLLRRTMPELRENHILPLQAELNGYAVYKQDERTFVFPNGSRIKCGYCDNDNDMLQYQGQEYEVICFDEATNFKEEWMVFILTCLRTTRTDFTPRVYFTANPGGVGHAYIKRLFIDREFRPGENPDDYVFIPATVYDNRALMDATPDYVKQLEALPEAKKKAHLYGDWNVYEGQVFHEFRNDIEHQMDRKNTHVIAPFTIPDTWRVYRGFDWGYSKPFAVEWIAFDGDNRAYLIEEMYGCTGEPNVGVKWSAEDIFRKIKECEETIPNLMNKDITGVADPAIFAKEDAPSIAETAEKYGVYFDRGKNDRINGWQQLHNRLMFDSNGIPMFYVFNKCKHFIRTLPILQYDETKPEDVNTQQEDHIADAVRYVLMARPFTPVPEAAKKPKPWSPFDDDDNDNDIFSRYQIGV